MEAKRRNELAFRCFVRRSRSILKIGISELRNNAVEIRRALGLSEPEMLTFYAEFLTESQREIFGKDYILTITPPKGFPFLPVYRRNEIAYAVLVWIMVNNYERRIVNNNKYRREVGNTRKVLNVSFLETKDFMDAVVMDAVSVMTGQKTCADFCCSSVSSSTYLHPEVGCGR